MPPYRAHTLLLLIASVAHFLMAYWVDRSISMAVIGCYSILWSVFLIQWADLRIGVGRIIAAGFLLRLVYLLGVPSLSDDVFRFVWDGLLICDGVSPYASMPTDWIEQTAESTYHRLFPVLNSPDYHSIYPPVLQFIFGSVAFLGNGNIHVIIVLLRIWTLLAEIGSMLLIGKLLKRWNLSPRNLMLYAFNPW